MPVTGSARAHDPPSSRSRLRLLRTCAAGLAVGAACGVVLLFGPASPAEGDANDRPSLDPARMIDAAHLPPLLTVPGEAITLRYDIYCPPPSRSASDACDADGSVFIRAGSAGPFRRLPLRLERSADEGRYATRVPDAIASAVDGFSYYAVVRNRATGAALALPSGGAAAPQRSMRVASPIEVDLGIHMFGRTRERTQRTITAAWGEGPSDAGLEAGPETQPIGPGAFGVRGDGTITVLDQVNRRALEFRPEAAKPTAVPLGVNGTLADLAVDGSGRLWVLETAGPDAPLLRAFEPGGRLERTVQLNDRTAAQLRLGPAGPVVKQYPSEQWVPAMANGAPLSEHAQRLAAEPARPVSRGREVALLRVGNEVRVALLGTGGIERAWRVHSSTPLAEVQLAEPWRDGLVLVLRTYTDTKDEFVVARLGARGLVSSFSLDSADWAETAPLSRFRLAGSSVYQLGSSPAGIRVDRFDLEVAS